MTNEFVGFSNRLVDTGNVGTQTIRDIQNSLSRFLELGKRAAREIGGREDLEEELDGKGKGTATERNETALRLKNADINMSLVEASPLGTLQPSTSHSTIQSDSSSVHNFTGSVHYSIPFQNHWRRHDPYTSTIWTPPIKPPDVDNSIVPHLLSGRDSFSTRLYYETINVVVRSLQGEAPFEIAARVLRYKLQFKTRSTILGVLAGVLEMLLLGTNQIKQGRIPQSELENEGRIKACIGDLIAAEGKKESGFLTSWEVERYLRERWSLSLDSHSVRIRRSTMEEIGTFSNTSEANSEGRRPDYSSTDFAPTVVPGFSQSDQILLNSDGLIDMLKLEAVSIGAGPRWYNKSVDGVVRAFLDQNNGRIKEVAEDW